jgi:hypothetical protein
VCVSIACRRAHRISLVLVIICTRVSCAKIPAPVPASGTGVLLTVCHKAAPHLTRWDTSQVITLHSIPERLLAFDVRLDRVEAARRRVVASAWALWPAEPFGTSVDACVWPSLFAPEAEAVKDPALIPIAPGEAPFWEAFGMWDDLREMGGMILPVHFAGEIVAVALAREGESRVPSGGLLEALCRNQVGGAEAEVTLLGYDIADGFLQSALFDSCPTPELIAQAPERSPAGLIASMEAAQSFLPLLETADRAHAPLFTFAVYALGTVPPVTGVSRR